MFLMENRFLWTKVYFMVPHFLFLRKSISGLLKAQNRQNGLVIFISKKWLNVPLKWRHFGFFKLWLCGGQQHFRVIFNWQGLFQLFNSCIWNSSRNFKLKTAKFQNIFRSCHLMCDWMKKLVAIFILRMGVLGLPETSHPPLHNGRA